MILQAITRLDVARYVGDLFGVYIALLLIYILANLVLSFGARPPYSRWFDAVMNFLRDVSEPYLRLFRRIIPSVGGIDLSPMLAIFVLIILDDVITGLLQ
ncbi:MAG: YggT family protein [Solirubrobacteraceae bacterium]